MDIKGVNRVGPFGAGIAGELKRNREGHSERDAQGNLGYQKKEDSEQLTKEQEEEALQALRASAGFADANLSAELVHEENRQSYILVLNAAGDVIRRLPYEQIVTIYVDRNRKESGGRLLNRVA